MQNERARAGSDVTNGEADILQRLDAVVRDPAAARVIKRVTTEVEALLSVDTATRLAWRALPLSIYGDLPAGIASSWVFALRRDCTSGAERHPNSVQRVMSYRGSADMQTWNADEWVSHRLISEPNAPMRDRWLSIPIGVWHKPVMSGGNWIVVSFHTAPDDELIEERATDDARPHEGERSELYAGRSAR